MTKLQQSKLSSLSTEYNHEPNSAAEFQQAVLTFRSALDKRIRAILDSQKLLKFKPGAVDEIRSFLFTETAKVSDFPSHAEFSRYFIKKFNKFIRGLEVS
jgi:hypothetical protein